MKRNIDPYGTIPHYRLEHTRRCFSDAQAIPPDAWLPLGTTKTAYMAGRRLSSLRQGMAKRCGRTGWGCHYRVLLVRPGVDGGADKTRECETAWAEWRTLRYMEAP